MNTKQGALMQLLQKLQAMQIREDITKLDMVRAIEGAITTCDYEIVDADTNRPWGAFFRMNSAQADDFVTEFFPGLDPMEARLGIADAELSPKILLVAPGQRLSWQYHNRRAERWRFITPGAYHKSTNDDQLDPFMATKDEVIQFLTFERHRLVGDEHNWTIVAEIWQHSDLNEPSTEDDIIRLSDDYNR